MGKRITCGSSCFLGRSGCKAIRSCACNCGPLKAINPNLFDACVDQCNSDERPNSADDFLCSFIGGETLYNNFGLIRCGYSPHESAQYQSYKEQMEDAAKANASSQLIGRVVIFSLLIVVVVGFLRLIIK